MSDITITHTPDSGTLAEGDTRPYKDVLKALGWRWGRSIGAWYVPNSRDRFPNMPKINQTVANIEGLGGSVMLEVDDTPTSTEERHARKLERLENRRDALEAKAERKTAEADAYFGRADQLASMIPFGQPILVGHHSERKSRKDQERIWNDMGRGVAAHKEAEDAARRARSSAARQQRSETAPVTRRRLERLGAELRKVERTASTITDANRASHPDWCRQVEYRLQELRNDIAYWTQHLADLEASGVKIWRPEDFRPGDYIRTRFGTKKVVRVNKKSLSCESGYSWTDKVPYDEVRGKVEIDAAAD